MTQEDLQEKYRDKRGEIKPAAIPLAADSAHLLTDYLDTVNVQLLKHGVVEAYRITREIEEILVLELQKVGSTTKLTYDATSKVLEKFGTPAKVVEDYISEHQPRQERVLAPAENRSMSNGNTSKVSEKQPNEHRPTGDYTTSGEVTGFFGFIGKPIVMGILLLNLAILSIIAVRVLFRNYFDLDLVIFVSSFILLELFTGMTGKTVIKSETYVKFREFLRFEVNVILILFAWHLFQGNSFYSRDPGVFIPFGLLVLGVGLLKDHTNLLTSFSPSKPTARFLIPSYLALIFAYIVSFFAMAFFYGDIDVILFFLIILISGVIGLFMDYSRKYPYSVKKLGYTLLLAPFIYMTLPVFDGVYFFIFAYILLITITLGFVFRSELSKQLEDYQLDLKSYENY